MSALEKQQMAMPPASGERDRPQHLEVVPDPAPNQVPVTAPEEAGEAPPAPPADVGRRDPAAAGKAQQERRASWRTDPWQRARAAVPTFVPPDFVAEPRPALRQLWNYGRFTTAVPAAGPSRAAAIGWAGGVAIPSSATAYFVAWTLERPSRTGVAAVLLALMASWEPTRILLSLVLYPLVFVLDLITNYPGVV